MSAYLVNTITINNILNGAIREGIILEEEATRVGRKLLRANIFSLRTLYDDYTAKDFKGVISGFIYNEEQPSDNEVIQSCRCLDYQACEYKSWERSIACKIINAVINAKLKRLKHKNIGAWYNSPEYESLAWQ